MESYNFQYAIEGRILYARLTEQGLCALYLAPATLTETPDCSEDVPDPALAEVLRNALDAYFAGEEVDFSEIPLDLSQGTDFQQAVWHTTATIPWGATAAYGDIAHALGKTGHAARAVGQALGRNPVPIVIPCHRVLAEGGALGGFGAGLDWKRKLLTLEGHGPFSD